MHFGADEHFYEIILPAIQEYHSAEVTLTTLINGRADPAMCEKARYTALRLGGAAAIYLHHFSDIVANRPPPLSAPPFEGKVGAVRAWVGDKMLKRWNENLIPLLGDTADALKHSTLNIRLPREVEERDQVLTISRGYGEGGFGEGKYGGIDEVWVLARSGKRPLQLVLHRVSQTWLEEIESSRQ